MHVSNRKVIYNGDIDQKFHAQEYPIIGSIISPVKYMAYFTSQLMSLRPNFVRPRVPNQGDHMIRHMVRCNTEAYANIEATYDSSQISRHFTVSRPVVHIKHKNEHKMRSKI